MPDDVINRVEVLACRQQANPGLVFGNWDQQPIDDLDDYYYDDKEDDDYINKDEHNEDEDDPDYEYETDDNAEDGGGPEDNDDPEENEEEYDHEVHDNNHEDGLDKVPDVDDESIVAEVWHFAHFWVSYGRCAMPGLPMGWSEGHPDDGQTKWHKW